MEFDEKSSLIRMDMRGSSHAEECLDCVVAFPAAVEQMRVEMDGGDHAETMLRRTTAAFGLFEQTDREGLLFAAAAAQDLLYRYITQLSILDRYTCKYCSLNVRYFFEQLSKRGVRTFYILDNTLREDRFQALLQLFELSGIGITTPRRDGTAWEALEIRLRAELDTTGHIAYIEPDDLVNHIDVAKKLAKELQCVATFRNLAPDNSEHEIINFQ
ncbi:MAG: hypothetical protein PF483_05790 [Halothiobacillus sp.]|nr:hypothetical protein [Halothiobacillus sp.]